MMILTRWTVLIGIAFSFSCSIHVQLLLSSPIKKRYENDVPKRLKYGRDKCGKYMFWISQTSWPKNEKIKLFTKKVSKKYFNPTANNLLTFFFISYSAIPLLPLLPCQGVYITFIDIPQRSSFQYNTTIKYTSKFIRKRLAAQQLVQTLSLKGLLSSFLYIFFVRFKSIFSVNLLFARLM